MRIIIISIIPPDLFIWLIYTKTINTKIKLILNKLILKSKDIYSAFLEESILKSVKLNSSLGREAKQHELLFLK